MSVKIDFEPYIERLLVYFSSEKYHEDLIDGKEQFYGELGQYEEDTEGYEQRLNLFFDWYLFTRGLSGVQTPPAQYALELGDFEIRDEERPFFESLAKTHHSLYEISKIRGESIYLKDLFTGQKRTINDARYCVGFNKDEVFDGRLIEHEEQFYFAKGFCFHPPQAKKFLIKEIKKVRKLESDHHESLMLRLIKMRFKVEQYKHLKIDDVYNNENKVKF